MSHYTYRAQWSPEYGQYVGSCLELPWVSREGQTAPEAIARVELAVDEYVADMAASGEPPPTSLAERPYSGKFIVRTSLELHRKLSTEAAEQGVSLNQWVVQQLSGRRPSDYLDF